MQTFIFKFWRKFKDMEQIRWVKDVWRNKDFQYQIFLLHFVFSKEWLNYFNWVINNFWQVIGVKNKNLFNKFSLNNFPTYLKRIVKKNLHIYQFYYVCINMYMCKLTSMSNFFDEHFLLFFSFSWKEKVLVVVIYKRELLKVLLANLMNYLRVKLLHQRKSKGKLQKF